LFCFVYNYFSKYSYLIRYEHEHVSTFLENFEAVAQKHEQRRQKIKKDVKENLLDVFFFNLFFQKEEIENEKVPPEYRITFGEKPEGITSKEYKLLYIETLYTIKYKIGTTTSRHIEEENDLYAYAQEAFGLSPADHQSLLAKTSEEKVICLDLKRIFQVMKYFSHQF
jgi:hemerythrin-like domain-containing protein